jgi:integrase
MQQCHQFVDWLKKNEEIPKVRLIRDARIYVKAYLNELKAKDYSAFTVHTAAAALAKLFECRMENFGVDLDKRERKVIKRSRHEPDPEYERKHHDIVDFYRGCGLRRCEMLRLKGEDVYRNENGDVIVHVRKGKGGKERFVTARKQYADHIEKMAGAVQPKEHVFLTLPGKLQNHHYRGDFAKGLYYELARPIEELAPDELYIMRKERAGEKFDRAAMLEVSRQLGHNRIGIIAESYLYKTYPSPT